MYGSSPLLRPFNFRDQPRRAFLRCGGVWLAGFGLAMADGTLSAATPLVRIGLLTDLHYADKDTRGTRHYRETLDKVAEAGAFFASHRPDFVVELGDLIDAADSVELEMGYLKRINRELVGISGKRHYVLGNHCVDTLTKAEFLGEVGQAESYYSFDVGGVRFLVLDACFRGDGVAYERKNFEWTDANLPPREVEWLRSELASATGPVIVFAHQRLDSDNHYAVKNAAVIRQILESSGKVLAVFQGHSHQNEHVGIGGIHYVTLRAMVEGGGLGNNGYALLDIFPGGLMNLTGGRLQESHRWEL